MSRSSSIRATEVRCGNDERKHVTWTDWSSSPRSERQYRCVIPRLNLAPPNIEPIHIPKHSTAQVTQSCCGPTWLGASGWTHVSGTTIVEGHILRSTQWSSFLSWRRRVQGFCSSLSIGQERRGEKRKRERRNREGSGVLRVSLVAPI